MTYTNSIPVPTNPPASDVVNMQNNTIAVNSWVQTDHVGFNAGSNSGTHNQVNFAANQTSPSLIGTSVAEIWTKAGTADSTHSQLMFQNTANIFQISAIRAWGYVPNGTAHPTQSLNVSSVSQSSNNWTVNLTSGAVTGTSFAVIAAAQAPIIGSPGHNAGVTVVSLGTNTFQLASYDAVTGANGVATAIFFIVLQI